ncbi:MAG: DUF4279 domain-containing protein [Pseudobacter sp.]|uniref:DUF4279 domain-containing protein n=1 Tax=Pseudobacter sp. TaxID=2045420 RepID=UPI003F7E6BA8
MEEYKDISYRFCFTIFSKEVYEVADITETLGLTPTSTWIKDPAQSKPLYRDYSFWKYQSEELFDPILEDVFINYFSPLESRLELISTLLAKDNLTCKIFILVKIHSGNSMPGIHVDWTLAAKLAAIKCNLDFDIYDFR